MVPLSHRHQLQPLQEIIDKSKLRPADRRPVKLLLPTHADPTQYDVQDGRSFLSVRLKRNNFNTESPPKRDRGTAADQSPPRRQETTQDETFRRMEGSTFFFKSIVTLIEKEPQKTKTPKFILENNPRDEAIIFLKSKKRSKSTSQRVRSEGDRLKQRSKTKPTQESREHSPLHTHLHPLREESVTRLKTFFLNTLQGL